MNDYPEIHWESPQTGTHWKNTLLKYTGRGVWVRYGRHFDAGGFSVGWWLRGLPKGRGARYLGRNSREAFVTLDNDAIARGAA